MHHISPTAIWISNFFLGVSAERGEDCFAQARIQKCGLGGGRVPKALEWRRQRRRRGWGLGGVSSSPVGVGSEGAPPQKSFGISSFEMVHFDAFWSMF